MWVLPLALGLLGLLVACSGEPQKGPQAQSPATTPTQQGAVQDPAPVALKLLKVEPVQGYIREPLTVTGEGLPPGKTVQFEWGTHKGTYATEVSRKTIRFLERSFVEKRVPLGKAVADAQGRVTATFATPEDYGEAHDIYAVVGGQDVAIGEFRVLRSATMWPTEGPIGTPITITVTGMGWEPSENTMAVLYDNKYTGLVTAVTTRGTAVVRVRAAGPDGLHTIQLAGAISGTPSLGLQQSPASHIAMDHSWTFEVTKDAGAPPNTLDWPSGSRVSTLSDAIPKVMVGGVPAAQGSKAGLEAPYGPVLSQTTLWARGLPPNDEVELVWVTPRSKRVGSNGRSETETPLRKATTDADGSLRATIQVPDTLGGWHVVKAVSGDKVLVEAPFFVQQSLVDVSPRRVKAGQTFTVQLKGVGWTDLDNAVAITYDNAYVGYACGLSCSGDITVDLVATGGPGTHLIDLYPTVSRAKGNYPPEDWSFQLPFLTALQDHPGQALGYELPIFRLAIEVVQ
ncbi:MAG: hypothetical protein HY683_00885 [Chloroflexi bacterium]|nr:hypothetical protein [Chloroflexota bacterium]